MDSSRRAVESYWRSRMIDTATSDEDKVTPVYKLEEISELLRSSHASIVKEVSEFILKRLDHKSPVVKQKALRLIKYAVGKSGVEFRREMQRHSVAVRQLFHYKGQPDPLKGDALNKAVRETAHEAISAIFSEENKPAPADDLNRRIQGFGNTNFDMPTEDKRSFLSEVVGLGSASFKQGLSSLTQGHSQRKNNNGNYKSPNLHRSLTIESDYSDRYEPVRLPNDNQGSFGASKGVAGGPWGQSSRTLDTEAKNGESSSGLGDSKTREERLLETVVTSGGVRLQPTRDAIQLLLVEAAKLDPLALSHALESKLQSPLWQVRMKAVCVLEAILRKKDDEHFYVMASYFSENRDDLVRCSESPQNSLREKANKVLSLLGGEQAAGVVGYSEKSVKADTVNVQMPDLIDTGDSTDFFGADESSQDSSNQKIADQMRPAMPFLDDLLGDSFGADVSSIEQKNDDDPFADVSFHAGEGRGQVDDLFSGMTVGDKAVSDENHISANGKGPELSDIFGSNEPSQNQNNNKTKINDLMDGMFINENISKNKQQEASSGVLSESLFSDSNTPPRQPVSNDHLSGVLGPQLTGMNASSMLLSGSMPYNLPPDMVLNPAFLSQQLNYGASLLTQQQFLATMSNFQHLNSLNAQNVSASQAAGINGGVYSSTLPDIFQSNFPNQSPTSMMSNTKKEDTKAFDFISDHVAAARDPRRVA
ncbi:hypothetical protein K2173_024706 [Erythroxylum novogranatense]|uniref:VHS domain-containing protein n=1 Tax=Erythroxylum novogranatense TaxID=1862640 RepID=A0AAV8SW51_9ROSI|nr:hypothetical protein K2173_024706 [Erythroxylum novogranatense]